MNGENMYRPDYSQPPYHLLCEDTQKVSVCSENVNFTEIVQSLHDSGTFPWLQKIAKLLP